MPSREEEAIAQARQKALGFNIILVTGGSGYIGSHTALELLVTGYAVVVIDNLEDDLPQRFLLYSFMKSTSPTEGPCVFGAWEADEPAATERKPLIKFAEEKILKKEKKIAKSVPKDIGALAVKQHFKCQEFTASSTQTQLPAEKPTKIKVNDVIHSAALKSVGESVSQPLNYYRTLAVLAVAYVKGKETNTREDSVQVGGGGLLTNPYGRSKWMDEEILNDTSVSDPEMQVIALRYFNQRVLTPVASSVKIREEHQTTLSHSSKTYPIKIAKEAAPPSAKDDLTSPISPTFARRLPKAGGSTRGSAFSNVCGNDIPFVLSDACTGDLGTVSADFSKASSERGWYAEFGLQGMCRDVYQWAVDNLRGYERLRRLLMMAQVDQMLSARSWKLSKKKMKMAKLLRIRVLLEAPQILATLSGD
ncbi:uncharacterized protein DFL_004219 [Arthrobotrys flagrans]|uniref:NAD-dependent epimerase/dehydratase domain-containing protein n=1 Tax=Arthrobotrys flagrans TaxID=97331 RepID=A0A437A460_ARTFL|nr:hypothetical protein DFL_004219 [Arthrobotrys flagrans]